MAIPQAPEGDLCSIYSEKNKLICSHVPSGVQQPDIPLPKADKYYCMSPEYWMKLENYVDELLIMLRQNSVHPMSPTRGSFGGIAIRESDVQRIKDDIWFMRKTMEQRRNAK